MTDELNFTGGSAQSIDSVEEFKFDKLPPIKGFPELRWSGKRPFTATQYYPAQRKEIYGEPVQGWMNKIFWGDNLQVMSHLLKEFRGQIDLVYIDPPFDSKAEYKKSINIKGKRASGDQSAFEEKQYGDIWVNDEYLQFIYERLALLRELMSSRANIFFHCDWHQSHRIRSILDEIFGEVNFKNEVVWVRSTNPKGSQHASSRLSVFTDSIFIYGKSSESEIFPDRIRVPLNEEEISIKYHRSDDKGPYYDGPIIRSAGMGERPNLVYEYKGYTPGSSGWRVKLDTLEKIDQKGDLGWSSNGVPFRKLRPEDDKGKPIGNFWNDISLINSQAAERVGYPTQKPVKLLERIIEIATRPGDLVFDCFMGSGTTQVVALKTGRRFIGADINLSSIETTIKRLNSSSHYVEQDELAFRDHRDDERYTGFEVFNVNNYDVFRNPLQAKEVLKEALEIQPLDKNGIFDGVKDGRKVKIMPVNRIATRQDLNEIITGLDQKEYAKKYEERPSKPVDQITLVCMGHEPDLSAALKEQMKPYELDVRVVDILRDKSHLEFKRAAEACVVARDGMLKVESFYPMNLLQKLSLQQEEVTEWRELVESIKIDWNFDGAVLTPAVQDSPEGSELVKGIYPIPSDAGTIRIKITDLLSESLELNVSLEV